ncbi:hypothetical protein OK18_20585 [Chryseobacterium gallinarum]|uniref:Uncharacterized protein n=1 Tax=Chryseobacterium gallinarum TaxID=1324352 RepID=A0A0G3M7W4_CHRGL|nr:hypothetical protein [Chryseobacterium gallinarum]AKK74685.1 hypothetical protein OK18_20585 [Chryseobacterium gallinarum]
MKLEFSPLSEVSRLRSKFKGNSLIDYSTSGNQNKKIPAFVGIFKQNNLQFSIIKEISHEKMPDIFVFGIL